MEQRRRPGLGSCHPLGLILTNAVNGGVVAGAFAGANAPAEGYGIVRNA